MNKIAIIIDTTKTRVVKVGLKIGEKEQVLEQEIDFRQPQVILPMINQLLSNNKLTIVDLTNIYVEIGPGSFTGIRVGVSVANTLGKVLNIPINDLTPGMIVEPVYE